MERTLDQTADWILTQAVESWRDRSGPFEAEAHGEQYPLPARTITRILQRFKQ